ncbi:type I secretion system permease/ATPase [Candidatus Methylopumilus turicensis]|uniref:Cyclolysin secretion/processing ATP-binding protein CyaB n=1 Tax=Candidatus Methylopumilus turicensis TaxID=1581680 RepID=A0A0B7J0Q2_9PROT|nr:type I secretion system permease/ATPase [Candidatus Methylopumilus turicensis]CEN56208.1 RTX-I toxin determinant B [Candidatus Methylopumilus turicensis]
MMTSKPTSTGINVMNVSEEQLRENEISSNDDLELNTLLARLARLQNVAMPLHRFSMASENFSGVNFMDLPRAARAVELWMNAFPSGKAYQQDESLSREHLPALWISKDYQSIKLIKGAMSHGGFLAEDFNGEVAELDVDEVMDGYTLILRPKIIEQKESARPISSARDWFLYALRKKKSVFIESIFATAMMSVLALASSFYTMQVYDRVIPSQGYSTLTVLTVGVLVGVLLELMMKQLRAFIVDRGCKAIDQELSGVFFGQVLDIRMDARPRSVGTFAGQIKNFEMVRNFMTSSTLFVLADAPFVLFFIAVIFAVAGWLALIPLLFLPVVIAIGLYAKWRISRYSGEQMDGANKKSGLLIETIDGIEAIKSVGGEWKMLGRWNNLTKDLSENELKIRTSTMQATSLTQSLQQLCYIAMIAAGAYAVTTGQITQGALIACSIISNRALSPIGQITGMIVQWQHAKEALKGLDDIMALECDRDPTHDLVIPETCWGNLSLDAATFSYTDDVVALAPLTLTIKPGERVGIIGSVGSGKSTLIKLLSGLYKPSEGRSFLDGVDMMQMAPEFVREHLGYLTQDVRLFHGTLRENLVMGLPSPTDSQILAAAAATGLNVLIQSHPKGLGLPIMEGGRGLSGGQRQLVGLTRMLIAKPKVLILDEPTASMDNELEAYVMQNLFAKLAPTTTIVLATHKGSLLKLVNRVIVMAQGKVIADGRPDDVMKKMTETIKARSQSVAKQKTDLESGVS